MIQPVGARVLIEQAKMEENKLGLIIEIEDSQFLPEGIVIAVGDISKPVAIGDHIVFNEMAGQRIENDGRTLLILEEKDILAKYA